MNDQVTKNVFYEGMRHQKEEELIWSDTFKLELANARIKVLYGLDITKYEKVEHVHRFRTYDSNGKEQTTSTVAVNHVHEVTWSKKEDGTYDAKCGPPLHKINEGKYQRIPYDDHTHKIEFEHSTEFKKRAIKTVRPEIIP